MKDSPPITFRTFHLFQILKQFDPNSTPLDRFLNHYFRTHTALGSKDRKYIAEIVYGIMRWQLLLDHLSGEEPTWEKRVALFQACQPAHFFTVNSLEPFVRVSFPKELFELMKKNYGEEKALHLCQISNTKAPLCIRINPKKTTREELQERFQSRYSLHCTQESTLGIQFLEQPPLITLEEYKNGLFEIQDEASQLISNFIPLKPDDQVLDFCSGSGGKSLAIAHKLSKKGTLYLHDIRPHILLEAKKRFKRAAVDNVHFLLPNHPQLKALKGKIDCVLVDVPCSGTGTLRRNPDQKWRFSLKKLSSLILQQRKIFTEALNYVKPGGSIVYATCSILQEENEEQRDFFLKTHNLTYESYFKSEVTYEGMDGFFAASFRKN